MNQRQEAILLSLKKLDFLNRDQLSQIHNLGKVRNTNRILNQLSPYLAKFRDEYSTIYYLSKEGREYVNSKKIRRKNQFVNHVIMRNHFYIFANCPVEWDNEIKISDHDFTVICDAIYKSNKKQYFVEVDSIQKMKENRTKIKQYLGLKNNGLLEKYFGYFPTLIWITTTELRRKQLNELCKDLPSKIYTLNEIK